MYKTTKPEYEIANKDIKFSPGDDAKLGQGGFGSVFKGQWSGRVVAIKMLTCTLTGEVEEDFRREIAIMLKLTGPQIIHTYGAVLSPIQAIVMELMPKGNLYNLLRQDKNLSWPLKYQIALDVAYGIKYLHERNILHRDLKSLNVLLNEKYQAKICDFGLATIKNTSQSHTTTKQKGAVGTVLWMAPELFDFDVVFTKKSDIYALGMVLYELLSHQAPFEGNLQGRNPSVVVPPWLTQGKRPEMSDGPEAFKALIKQCWSQDIDMRPLAENVIQTLEQIKLIDQMSKLNTNAIVSGPQYLGFSGGVPSAPERHHSQVSPQEPTKLLRPVGFSAMDAAEEMLQEQRKPSIPASPAKPKPAAAPAVNPQEVSQFLHHIGYGEQDEAESMLKANKKLVLAHGDLTDCSKRTWREITAFQYAVLALDYHMWSMLLGYLDDTQIRAQLEELANNAILNEGGWVIKSAWTNKWPAVGWTKLIEALDIYIKNYDPWTIEQCRTHWRQQVGGAQLILPAHVINEYSHPSRPFYPCPKWGNNEASLPRQGVSDWLIAENGKYNLGKDFAWARANWSGRTSDHEPRYAKYDRAAVNELLRARIEQARILLETKLQTKPSSTLRLAR